MCLFYYLYHLTTEHLLGHGNCDWDNCEEADIIDIIDGRSNATVSAGCGSNCVTWLRGMAGQFKSLLTVSHQHMIVHCL